jgi:ATP phosphoribosyltransferase regulatory subunit HisZ
MSNWQRKSEYLLREIVKFRTYIESLTAASTAKEIVLARRAERDAELAVIRSNAAAAVAAAADKEAGDAAGERMYDDDDDSTHDVFEESQESRDITPRQSSVPPAAVTPVA